MVGGRGGRHGFRAECCGDHRDAEAMGVALANELLANGAEPILQALYAK